MIEAGYIGHYGLLIRPQRTHDVYASPSTQQDRERLTKKGKQRERQSEAKATQSYMVLAPYRMREQGELGGGIVAPSLGPQLQVPPITITTTHHHPSGGMSGGTKRRRTSVLLERVEGHWSLKFMVGAQTHTDCKIKPH